MSSHTLAVISDSIRTLYSDCGCSTRWMWAHIAAYSCPRRRRGGLM